MTDQFLAIGECMVELALQPDGAYAMGFAGDTFNTAWYARRSLPEAWRVGYLSAVGRDAVSDRMLAFMTGAGIDTRAVARLPDRTVGLYMIELVKGERSFSYWRGQSAARALAADAARLAAALDGVTLAYKALPKGSADASAWRRFSQQPPPQRWQQIGSSSSPSGRVKRETTEKVL